MTCASGLEGKYATKPLAHAMTSNLAITNCRRIVQTCLVCVLITAATLTIFQLYNADTAMPAGSYHGDFRRAPPGSNRYPKPPSQFLAEPLQTCTV